MPEAISLTTGDGFRLQARLYLPQAEAQRQLLIACATAVPQGFYQRCAEFFAAAGYRVLTLDYRGIGASAPKTLRGFRVNYLDWARQDLSAGLDHLAQQPQPIFYLGHSYGGHALGLIERPERIQKAVFFATGAGWHGWMEPAESFKAQLMWALLPPLSRVLGYMPGRPIGGEDLPLDIARTWKQWCSYPRYFFDDPSMADQLAGFSQVRVPILAGNATDDAWALAPSRDAFMSGYTSAPWQGWDIHPAAGQNIGHMGYFRRHNAHLWEQAKAWLEA